MVPRGGIFIPFYDLNHNMGTGIRHFRTNPTRAVAKKQLKYGSAFKKLALLAFLKGIHVGLFLSFTSNQYFSAGIFDGHIFHLEVFLVRKHVTVVVRECKKQASFQIA